MTKGIQKTAMNILGERFCRLVVLKKEGRDFHNKTIWLCQCDCGKQTIVEGSALKIGNTRSCGCLRNEQNVNKLKNWHGLGTQSPRFKHGRTPEYNTYCNMRTRCYNPNSSSFPLYGGRGIKVCDRWLGENGFNNFLLDMNKKPSPKYSLDRINVNEGYSPSNCKWATPKEQANNTRRKRIENFSDIEIRNEIIRRGLKI